MNRDTVIKEVAKREEVKYELIDAIVYELGLVDDDIEGISINGSVLKINSMEFLLTKDYDEAVELAVESMLVFVKEFYDSGNVFSEFITNEFICIIGENIDLSEYAIVGYEEEDEEYIPSDIWELVEEHGHDKLSLIKTNATDGDFKEISGCIVRIDGVGMTLATYDHDEIELHNGYWMFRTD